MYDGLGSGEGRRHRFSWRHQGASLRLSPAHPNFKESDRNIDGRTHDCHNEYDDLPYWPALFVHDPPQIKQLYIMSTNFIDSFKTADRIGGRANCSTILSISYWAMFKSNQRSSASKTSRSGLRIAVVRSTMGVTPFSCHSTKGLSD
jgi:hypothetical protein